MEHLSFAYPFVFAWVGASLLCGVILAFLVKRRARYQYALSHTLLQHGVGMRMPVRHILFILRFCSLALLGLLIARPQWVSSQRTTVVSGIDMVLALDASGSMELFDDLKDRTPRFESMRKEALDFIEKRTNDPIGIVIFGAQALSKIPLTLDKTLLLAVVREMAIGDVDPNDTLLLTAAATAINRLRGSTAKSKVLVLLTDGVPSQNDRITPEIVVELAREFGIKIYTLGVGRDEVAYTYDPFGRVGQVPSVVDTDLLLRLASETGGHFFRVKNPADMKKAYDAIDRLERTEITTPLFQKYYEAFSLFIWWFLMLFALELLLRLGIWRGLV